MISAGFCLDDLSTGGQSETLKVASRGAQDLALLKRMLHSSERETWDFVPSVEQGQPPTIKIPFP